MQVNYCVTCILCHDTSRVNYYLYIATHSACTSPPIQLVLLHPFNLHHINNNKINKINKRSATPVLMIHLVLVLGLIISFSFKFISSLAFIISLFFSNCFKTLFLPLPELFEMFSLMSSFASSTRSLIL